MNTLHRYLCCAFILTAVLATSCGDATGPTPGAPTQLLLLSGNEQSAVVGEELPDPIVVRVEDASGLPVPRALVNFVVSSGGGQVFSGSALTNDAGEARERWTLGTTTSEPQRLEARAVDSGTGEKIVFAVFQATALPDDPAAVEVAGGDAQQSAAATQLADSIAVRVVDQYGNPVPAVEVQWSTAHGGSFSPPSTLTSADGIARTAWTLGPSAAPQTAVATHAGHAATISANAVAGVLHRVVLTPDTVRFAAVGISHNLELSVLDSLGNEVPQHEPVEWSRCNTTVAALSPPPVLYSVADGTSCAVATVQDRADTTIVIVQQVVTAISVAPAADSLLVADTLRLVATARDANARIVPNPALTWATSDEARATVSTSGVVSGIARGTVIISTSSGAASDSSTLTVMRRDSIAPVLSLAEPLNYTVAQPSVRLRATCADDDPLGCEAIRVRASTDRWESGPVIASSGAALDTVVDLSGFPDVPVILTFEGRDPLNVSVAQRMVLVERSPALTAATTVDGVIVDANASHVLFFDSAAGRIVLHDRGTGSDQTIMESPQLRPSHGFITPEGALFVNVPGNVLTARLLEWRGSGIIDHGHPNSTGSLRVAGNHAIWNEGTTLVHHDIPAGVRTVIATNVINTDNDVAENGDIVYATTGYDVVRYRAGVATPLTNTGTSSLSKMNVYPMTDGDLVVYRTSERCCNADRVYWLVLLHGDSAVDLTPSWWTDPHPGRDYQVRSGRVAFTKRDGAGVEQVWTWEPGVGAQQVTSYARRSHIEALGPAGEIVFLNNGRRLLRLSSGAVRDVGASNGRAVWIGSDLYILLGRSLLLVT